ncbi:hypothetical protein C9374_003947 [Naegleria lovaniensis]|uniref:Uncharacterized protein n=1 Tax=Naegleria lovaniensis TaxID=51637 RepID=A0AA88H467_NAELO|nr:uncharacterized protein C9374_003947 [Naegleria lovaniensis]KAG2394183.1 hypothetical protein C9374_003947 [Naegleria lovaniensis]
MQQSEHVVVVNLIHLRIADSEHERNGITSSSTLNPIFSINDTEPSYLDVVWRKLILKLRKREEVGFSGQFRLVHEINTNDHESLGLTNPIRLYDVKISQRYRVILLSDNSNGAILIFNLNDRSLKKVVDCQHSDIRYLCVENNFKNNRDALIITGKGLRKYDLELVLNMANMDEAEIWKSGSHEFFNETVIGYNHLVHDGKVENLIYTSVGFKAIDVLNSTTGEFIRTLISDSVDRRGFDINWKGYLTAFYAKEGDQSNSPFIQETYEEGNVKKFNIESLPLFDTLIHDRITHNYIVTDCASNLIVVFDENGIVVSTYLKDDRVIVSPSGLCLNPCNGELFIAHDNGVSIFM